MRLIKKSFFCLLLLFATVTQSQNLVSNPGLEPTMWNWPGQISQFNLCPGWMNCTTNNINFSGTPDYFCTNSTSTPVWAPANVRGWQQPHGGTAYAGISIYNPSPSNFREYIETQLTQTLTAGQTYDFEMFISLADKFQYTTDDIGVYFSTTMISGVNHWDTLPFNAQLYNTVGNKPDTGNWTRVSGTYTAQGGEQYMIIGNFKGYSRTDYTWSNPMASNMSSFFFIDDVSFAQHIVCDVTLSGDTNICAGTCTALTASGATNYTWMPGNLNSPTVTVCPTGNTIYTVTGTTGTCVATQTIAVTALSSPVAAFTDSLQSNHVFLTDSSYTNTSDSIVSWYWTFNTGSPDTSTQQNPDTYLNFGIDTICLTVTSSNGCTDSSCQLINVNTTDIRLWNANTITISPNPSVGTFSVHHPFPAKNTWLKVYSSLGNLVYQCTVTEKRTEVDLSSYPKGLYFVVITDGKKSWTGKVVVE